MTRLSLSAALAAQKPEPRTPQSTRLESVTTATLTTTHEAPASTYPQHTVAYAQLTQATQHTYTSAHTHSRTF